MSEIIKPIALVMTMWASELDILRSARSRLEALRVLTPSEELQAEIHLLYSLEWRTAGAVKFEDVLGLGKENAA